MSASTKPLTLIAFGPFELDLTSQELRKQGHRLHLPRQSFQILKMLLERPGELVSRDELRASLWPSDTFVDFEHGLNAAINRLRETLGDNAEDPRYVETLPRRGYRFIARLSAAAVNSPSALVNVETVEPTLAPTTRSFSPRRVWFIVLCTLIALVLILLGVGSIRKKVLSRLAVDPQIHSIAVLPLTNLSGDPQQDYFADAMTEELITSLAEISALRVVSRTSVMQYKDTTKPVRQIARELHVDAIIEGSVVRFSDRIRINAQLIRGSTDDHIWGESYDRNFRDVLSLQSEVAVAIARQVQAKLTPQERLHFAGARPVNLEAYDAYLKARYYGGTWTPDGSETCVKYSLRSIALDPTFAPAHAVLSSCHIFSATSGRDSPLHEFPIAKAAVSRALELDNTLAEAHTWLGTIQFQFDWDWANAERELKQAVLLNPNSGEAHIFYGVFLVAMGRFDEALRESQTALELDPLAPMTNLQLAWVLYYARRHDESIAQLHKSLELAPNLGYVYMELGWNDRMKGIDQDAVMLCRRAVELMPDNQIVLGSCGSVFGVAGERDRALALLARLKKSHPYVDAFNVAHLYDGLGNNDDTIEWLERAYRERAASLYLLRSMTWTPQLRNDPRFQDLLHRLNYPNHVN